MVQGVERTGGLRAQRPAGALRGIPFGVFAFFLLFYSFTNAGWYKIGDESAMTHLARHIVRTGSVGILSSDPIDQEYEGDILRGRDGKLYYKWGLGQSIVEVPFLVLHRFLLRAFGPNHEARGELPIDYLASEWIFLVGCVSTISALGCLFFFLLSLRLGFDPKTSVILTLLYGIGTMAWPYAKSLMSEATLNTAVLGGIWGVVSYGSSGKRWWLSLAGGCLGFAFVTKPTSVFFVPLVVAYAMMKVGGRKYALDLLLSFMLPFLMFLALQAWHNFIRYEGVWDFGSYGKWGILGFCTPLYVGLWGLLASPGKSFFLYAPLSLLGLVSARAFFNQHRQEALLFFSIAVTFTVLHARWCLWAGDWAWGPRFLLPITPYLVLPLGLVLASWKKKSRMLKAVVTAVIIVSVFIQVLGVAIHPFAFIQTRNEVVMTLLSPSIPSYTYADTYSENTFINFSPLFSHIIGNWWLFKHMLFPYDLWSDAPWKVLGDFSLSCPQGVIGNRTVPFWWPVMLPLISPPSKGWVYPLAAANLLGVIWWGLRLRRLAGNLREEEGRS